MRQMVTRKHAKKLHLEIEAQAGRAAGYALHLSAAQQEVAALKIELSQERRRADETHTVARRALDGLYVVASSTEAGRALSSTMTVLQMDGEAALRQIAVNAGRLV